MRYKKPVLIFFLLLIFSFISLFILLQKKVNPVTHDLTVGAFWDLHFVLPETHILTPINPDKIGVKSGLTDGALGNGVNSKSFLSPSVSTSDKILSAKTSQKYWLPNTDYVYDSAIKTPDLTAVSAISYDMTNNLLLYKKDINKRLPVASLTKIMTAIIALENEDFDQVIEISNKAASIGDNSMGLSSGERLTVEELLYGLILPSGNDAAESLAEGGKLNRKNFIDLMNTKARDLGLSDTYFTNPSGLEGDGNQYSSAYDLLVVTAYGLKNKNFAKVVSTVEYNIPSTSTHKAFNLFNDTSLLTTYPGVKGVKIGYTDEAGLCMVSYLEYKNHKIIAVLINSTNRREEMKELLDYSLRSQGVEPPPHS